MGCNELEACIKIPRCFGSKLHLQVITTNINHVLRYCHAQTFCVPNGIPLGCGAFVGATYQSCGSRYTTAQALAIAASVVDGNYTAPVRAQSASVQSANFRPLLAVLTKDFNKTMFAGAQQPTCTHSLSCICNVSNLLLSFWYILLANTQPACAPFCILYAA
jgi:hypothetical protein